MKKPVRIVTVVFALSMLATYVVFSQLQQNRSVASSSKYLAPTQFSGTNTLPSSAGSNPISSVIAPGSKTLAPVLKLNPGQPSSGSNVPSKVAPGSKSSAVFDLRPTEKGTPSTSTAPTATGKKPKATATATNSAPASTGAPHKP